MIKRLFDFSIAAFSLIAISPLLILVGIIIKLSDGGSVFYRQVRVGRFGCHFKIWKFRSMRVGSDGSGLAITRLGDARITFIGRALRRTKLDELPQLFNVISGEMSLVGPRPEVPMYVALYSTEQMQVLQLRPGITDLASLYFRNEEAMLAQVPDYERFYREVCIPRKIALNLEYSANASIWTDTEIIWITVLSLGGIGVRGGCAKYVNGKWTVDERFS